MFLRACRWCFHLYLVQNFYIISGLNLHIRAWWIFLEGCSRCSCAKNAQELKIPEIFSKSLINCIFCSACIQLAINPVVKTTQFKVLRSIHFILGCGHERNMEALFIILGGESNCWYRFLFKLGPDHLCSICLWCWWFYNQDIIWRKQHIKKLGNFAFQGVWLYVSDHAIMVI